MEYREDKEFKLRQYDIEVTGDLSPTLRPDKKESMHHMGGAAGESVYIYYEALAQYFQLPVEMTEKVDHRILSFGFGMGYNEILTVLYFLKNKRDLTKLKLFSYEKDLFLYDLFNQWITQEDSSVSDSVFDQVYDGIQRATAHLLPLISKSEVKQAMRWLLEDKGWVQSGPVSNVSDFHGPFDVVFYDAFSAKTNDFLWTEEFLNDFFKSKLNPVFVFSTYACTGKLKRVAGLNNATFEKRDGFKGKRNSSRIIRV